MKKKFKWWFIILVIVMIIAMILSFPVAGNKVGEWIGVAGDKVVSTARTALAVGIGLFLISAGVGALSIPVVGIALIVVGIVLVGYSLWPYFSKVDASKVQPED